MATIDVSSLQTFTAAQLLTLVEYAIAHLLAGGQSYSIGSRTVTKANLAELREWRKELKAEVNESSSVTGTLTALADFGRQQ